METTDEKKVEKSEAVEERLKERLSALCAGRHCKSFRIACQVEDGSELKDFFVGLVLEYASWNKPCTKNSPFFANFLTRAARRAFDGLDCNVFQACIQVDENDQAVGQCIGDVAEEPDKESDTAFSRPVPPGSLPAIALVLLEANTFQPLDWRYVPNLQSSDLLCVLSKSDDDSLLRVNDSLVDGLYNSIKKSADGLANDFHMGVDPSVAAYALRIFVAGDRSSVGKSSVCLGLLGNLLAAGFTPESLAYIKPATQSESTQLVQLYCDQHGIACVPVGPLVYFRGFTRAFLAGETQSADQLLEQVGRAVDRVARGKRVVLVDGVGFPAVGSICGTDNASVAKACGYPTINGDRSPMGVVLVGGSGVGAAVDAFNLNSTYFEQASVPVMGAIFNKLADSGYYSLENCKTQVTAYFDSNEKQQRLGRRPFGFVPLFPAIAGKEAMQHVDDYIGVFGQHVDVSSIVQGARQIREGSTPVSESLLTNGARPIKRKQVDAVVLRNMRSRQDIEGNAIGAGAAPSA